jgi:hypothetical protein
MSLFDFDQKRAEKSWVQLDEWEKGGNEKYKEREDRLFETNAPKADVTALLVQTIGNNLARIEMRQKVLYSIGIALLEFKSSLIQLVILYCVIEILKRWFS